MNEPPKRRMQKPPAAGPARGDGQRPKAVKARSPSSRAWIERQLADPFAAAARARGYRSRAAFKLAEIDARFGLVGHRAAVVDLGCAPGGWLQVALERGAKAIVGIDLLPTEPVAGADILQGDFTAEGAAQRLIGRLGQAPDLILSDMAPNTIGHRRTDHLRIMALLEEASAFALARLRPGGTFLAKAFQGGETARLALDLKRAFAEVRYVKPKASRAESSELYLLARGFKG